MKWFKGKKIEEENENLGELLNIQASVQDLISDIKMLSEAAAAGNYNVRADLDSHKGDFKNAVQKLNSIMNVMETKVYEFENILDSIPFYIYVFDQNNKLVFLNKLSLDLFGIDRKFAIGMNRQEWTSDYNALVDMGVKEEIARDLSQKEFQLDDFVLCNNKDEASGIVCISQDVTKKARAEAYTKKEVEKLATNLGRLKDGNLHLEFSVGEEDPYCIQEREIFKAINHNFKQAVESVGEYINELSFILEKFAEGDMTVEIKNEFHGDFITIKNSVCKIINTMNQILAEINNTAEEVANGSNQVSAGNQTIAQGATEQASSIEELTVTINFIAEQTKQNVETSNDSKKMAMESMDLANEGNEQMKKMLYSMDEINQSSERISKIIKVIDELASRTNILSLNASVEAARAGVHGKGFAVVAEEVRNLALQSAQAAKETAELIKASVKKVKEGTEIADKTAKALSEIIQGASRAVELEEKIVTALKEQNTSIMQVSLGIQQMSQVVQANSAITQESAAASEELNGQAQLLKEKVGMFKLKEQSIE